MCRNYMQASEFYLFYQYLIRNGIDMYEVLIVAPIMGFVGRPHFADQKEIASNSPLRVGVFHFFRKLLVE